MLHSLFFSKNHMQGKCNEPRYKLSQKNPKYLYILLPDEGCLKCPPNLLNKADLSKKVFSVFVQYLSPQQRFSVLREDLGGGGGGGMQSKPGILI